MISTYIKCPELLFEYHKLPEGDTKKYIDYLISRRYSGKTITSYISGVIHYLSWRRSVDKNYPVKITDKLISSFLSRHLKTCKCPSSFQRGRTSCGASVRLWRKIISEVNFIPTPTKEEQLFEEYNEYLKSVVGLVKISRQTRLRYGRELTKWLKKQLSKELSELTLKELAAYVYQRSSSLSSGSVTAMVSALGCFVSYLSSIKHCNIPLPIYIPRPKPVYAIPVYEELSEHEILAILKSFDRNTAIGKRDHAMVCCLVELGLRTCDTAHLSLDGIDWRHQVLTLGPSKNRRQHRLPISAQLLDALIDYVKNGRPTTTARAVFVYHRAPLGLAVSTGTVRGAIRRAFVRAKIPTNRSQLHRFRHTMATRLLKSGTSIKAIADVLGHQSIEASNRYMHVDLNSLKEVALPWPNGGES